MSNTNCVYIDLTLALQECFTQLYTLHLIHAMVLGPYAANTALQVLTYYVLCLCLIRETFLSSMEAHFFQSKKRR